MEEDLDGNSSQALVKRRIIDEIAEEKLRGTYLIIMKNIRGTDT